MVCIFCSSETEVKNSRSKAKTPSVWRRRVCKVCVAQFSTIELPDYARALRVEMPGNKKPIAFSRDRLFLSLQKSLAHRADAVDAASALSATVISRLLKLRHKDGVYSSQDIAKRAYEILKRFDPLAAHTYKAYHQASLK